MATTDIHHIPAARPSFAGLMARLRSARSRRSEYHRVYSELAQFSDRDLTDIGISRSNIRDIAWQAAYGK